MVFDYFAGPIFTTQEYVLYCTIAFLVASVTLGLVMYGVSRLYRKVTSQPASNKKFGIVPALVLGVVIIALLVFFRIVMPTVIKDAKWRNKQAECAKQVGYADPAEDDSLKATAESQDAYSRCIRPSYN